MIKYGYKRMRGRWARQWSACCTSMKTMFNIHNLCKKLGMMVYASDLNAMQAKPGSLELAGQLAYPNR